MRFAQVPERVSTKSFVVLIIGNSKSNHFGAHGTFKRPHSDANVPAGGTVIWPLHDIVIANIVWYILQEQRVGRNRFIAQ